jgi:phenylpyruvate tautomerase PptA (4-oxalocrotonate tautomerase family)
VPILNVEIVGSLETSDEVTLAQRIADAAGEVFGAPPRSTWIRLRVLPATHYAENGGADPNVRPVFVQVMKRLVPAGDELRTEVAPLTEAIAAAYDRPPENVHVCYEPAATGRQAFGGAIVGE